MHTSNHSFVSCTVLAGALVCAAGMPAALAETPGGRAAEHAAPAGTTFEHVYYDYVNERGELTGGRAALAVTPRDRAWRIPANVTSQWVDFGRVDNRIDLTVVGDGYQAGQLGFYHAHANASLSTWFAQEPFKTYSSYFNIHIVDVVSNQSGVDHDPTYPLWRDTALDMGFWCANIERLLCVDVGKAYAYAQSAPDVDMLLAVANSTKYGGAGYPGNDLATVSGGNSSAAEVAIHEFGHSLGDLADEYDYGGPQYYTGPEPSERNVSILNATQMAAAGTKWARWLGYNNSAYDGLINTYEGAMYSVYGIYRPTTNSKMRSLGRPFNLPGIEGIIIEIYKIVRPIDDATPAGQVLTGRETAFVTPLAPVNHKLDIQWALDGQPLPGATGAALNLRTVPFTLGTHTLGVTVMDNTWFVRDPVARQQWLTESRAWTVQVTSLMGDLNCDSVVDFVDINPFVLALENPAGYHAQYPNCDRLNGDFNGDDNVDFADINLFVSRLAVR